MRTSHFLCALPTAAAPKICPENEKAAFITPRMLLAAERALPLAEYRGRKSRQATGADIPLPRRPAPPHRPPTFRGRRDDLLIERAPARQAAADCHRGRGVPRRPQADRGYAFPCRDRCLCNRRQPLPTRQIAVYPATGGTDYGPTMPPLEDPQRRRYDGAYRDNANGQPQQTAPSRWLAAADLRRQPSHSAAGCSSFFSSG